MTNADQEMEYLPEHLRWMNGFFGTASMILDINGKWQQNLLPF
jgi:hypothetical protein